MTNRKTTKRALLSSILALVLCFAMLLGTTFAWFTDTASTSVNKIQAGTLKVKLQDANGDNLEGKTLSWKKAAEGSSQEILWEPGCTYELEPVTIKNNGNLALKYKIVITGIQGDAPLNEAIDWTFAVSGEGSNTDASQTNVIGLTERSLSAGKADTLTISGTMKTTAGNEYQGLSIDGIAITVYATQDTVEFDSSTNEYDKDAEYDAEPWDGTTTSPVEKNTTDGTYHITSAAQFATFVGGNFSIPAGSTVLLDCDVDLGGATVTGYYNSVFDSNFDGQGHTVSNFTVTTNYFDGEHYCGLFPYVNTNCYVKNLTVKDAMAIAPTDVGMVGIITGAAYTGATVENCHVENCTVVGQKKVGAVIGYISNANVINCSATDCAVYCKVTADTPSSGKIQADEVIGYNDNPATGYTVDSTDSYSNVSVTFGVAPTLVSSAAELKTALEYPSNGGGAPARNIVITSDLDMSTWAGIDTASNYPSVTIEGNGHTLKNLAAPLFINTPGRDYTFKNLTFTNVNINGGDAKYALGVVIGEGQTNGGGVYTFENCHINGGSVVDTKTNSTNDSSSTAYVGGFIGYAANGATLKFTNCSVNNVTVSGYKSTGGFIGHTKSAVEIKDCSILGNTSVTCTEDRSGSGAKAGYFIGTIQHTTTIESSTVASTALLNNTNATAPLNDGLVGRNVSGSLTVN